jgi:hypothetical protein
LNLKLRVTNMFFSNLAELFEKIIIIIFIVITVNTSTITMHANIRRGRSCIIMIINLLLLHVVVFMLYNCFHRHNPSGRSKVVVLTQLLTEMSTRNISGGKGGRCVGMTTLPP